MLVQSASVNDSLVLRHYLWVNTGSERLFYRPLGLFVLGNEARIDTHSFTSFYSCGLLKKRILSQSAWFFIGRFVSSLYLVDSNRFI